MEMRNRFVLAAPLIVVMCLAGCGPVSGGTSATSAPTTSDTDQMVADCLDLWLNTDATQTVIDNGMTDVDNDGLPVHVVTQNADGSYHADQTSPDFFNWVISNYGMPWAGIRIAIFNGVGCPYDPVVKAKLDQEEQDCLQVWVNRDAPQAAIEAGLATTGPDGTPVQPVLTSNLSGQYTVDIHSDNLQAWVTNHDGYVPWDNIYTQALAGQGAPFDLPDGVVQMNLNLVPA